MIGKLALAGLKRVLRSRWVVFCLLVLALSMGLMPIGPTRSQPAMAHAICAHTIANDPIKVDNRYFYIDGHAWTTVCGSSVLASPDDSWFECWPVHRHHLGLTWWWHSHSSTGARHLGTRNNYYWGDELHYKPDSNGVKTRCEYDIFHGNWSKATDESNTIK
jgi:hypothetical protein